MRRSTLWFFVLFSCSATHALASSSAIETHLLLVGGGSRPTEALAEFVKASGGKQANILVVPWASATNEGAKNIQAELLAFHPRSVSILPRVSQKHFSSTKVRRRVLAASGIFFAGGDQNRLMSTIFQQNLKPLFQAQYKNGVAFGGTSAGTAIMSERMMTGDQSPLAVGLGLLPPAFIIDQHFVVRQRFTRLRQWVERFNRTYGIGIDENTSLWVTNNETAKVIGPSQVVFFWKDLQGKVQMKLYMPNESFNVAF